MDGLEARGLPYVVGVHANETFRLAEEVAAYPGDGRPPPYSGRGRLRKAAALEDRIDPEEAREWLDRLPEDAWEQVAWWEGTKDPLVKQFARLRVFRTGARGQHLEPEVLEGDEDPGPDPPRDGETAASSASPPARGFPPRG